MFKYLTVPRYCGFTDKILRSSELDVDKAAHKGPLIAYVLLAGLDVDVQSAWKAKMNPYEHHSIILKRNLLWLIDKFTFVT